MKIQDDWYLCCIFEEVVSPSNQHKRKMAYLKKVSKYYLRAKCHMKENYSYDF